jgi:tetratricopeptide (TPR) repeat protein
LQEALHFYQQVLKIDVKQFDALQLSATIHAQIGNHSEALMLFNDALKINQKNANVFNNRGNVLKELKRFDEAIDSFTEAIRLKPDLAEAFNNRGNALTCMKRFEDSIANYAEAIRIKPDYFNAYKNLGDTLQELKRFEDSIASYAEAIRINPEYADAFINLGNLLKGQNLLDDALYCYAEAIRIKPNHAQAFNNQGHTLKELKRFHDALYSYEEAIRINPDYADAFNNRGNTLQELKRFDDAFASFTEAIRINPKNADFFINRGSTLLLLNRFDDALASYTEAIRIEPNNADAFYNRGLLSLLNCEFVDGFNDCLHRWNSKDFPSYPIKSSLPRCTPETFGEHVLLWAEQGLGDEVLYAGLLSEALNRDVSITLSADKRLLPILQRSFPEVRLIDNLVLRDSSVDEGYDFQAPVGDLGYLLKVDTALIKSTRSPYLKSDPQMRMRYRSALSSLGEGLACGIAWKSANKQFGADKSVNLNSFRSLLTTPGFSFVNLQYGDVGAEIQSAKEELGVTIHQIEGLDVFNDIDGLLALIDACDVVVTTSNVTAHLAGSAGKRAAVLVPYGKGKIWYWHKDHEYSLWYPNLRLFYQDDPLDWTKPIDACTQWIRSLI